jgi:hypothetical protein
MQNAVWLLPLAGTLLASAHPVPAETGHPIAKRTLCIHLYDAQVPAGTLNWAMVEATQIFKSTGIEFVWQRPTAELPEDQGLDMSSAAHWKPGGRQYLVVRLLTDVSVTVAPGVLGVALPFARTGAHVTVFLDRVEEVARSTSAAPYVILGHAMTHEIGHVLLRSSDHAAAGLMQAQWNQATWRLASAGLITFLPPRGRTASRRTDGTFRPLTRQETAPSCPASLSSGDPAALAFEI